MCILTSVCVYSRLYVYTHVCMCIYVSIRVNGGKDIDIIAREDFTRIINIVHQLKYKYNTYNTYKAKLIVKKTT